MIFKTILSLIRQKTKIQLFLLCVAALISYSNSLNGQLVYDDITLIAENAYIKNLAYLPKIFYSDIGAGFGKTHHYGAYRPLQMTSYMYNYRISKLNLFCLHFTNLLFHLAAGLALYWLISLLFQNKILSLLTSLFFIVHPAHSEAVSYISGRADPMAALFMLISFGFYVKLHTLNKKEIISSRQNYWLMLLAYSSALLSRENAVIFPLLLLLYHFAFKIKINLKYFIPLSTLLIIYSLIRFTLLKNTLSPLPEKISAFHRLPGAFAAFLNYLRILIIPFDLHMEYGIKTYLFNDPRVITGLILLVSLIFLMIKTRKNNFLFFGLGWFFLTLLPAFNLYPLNAFMAEHWLYMPAMGFFLTYAYWIIQGYKKFPRFKNIFFSAAGIITCFYMFITFGQNIYWQTPLFFYERTLSFAPHSAAICINLATLYSQLGKNDQAQALLEQSLRIKPNNPYAYYNLATITIARKDYSSALDLLKTIVQLSPNYAQAYNSMGIAYRETNQLVLAEQAFKKAIALNPDHERFHNNLGLLYAQTNQHLKAIDSFLQIIKINPNSGSAYNNIAVSYYHLNKYDLAAKYCRLAQENGTKPHQEFLNQLNQKQ